MILPVILPPCFGVTQLRVSLQTLHGGGSTVNAYKIQIQVFYIVWNQLIGPNSKVCVNQFAEAFCLLCL